ncbi:putative protease YdcP [Nymphon striatum]|nr:putative protease YdcP [Nymphon striatum]
MTTKKFKAGIRIAAIITAVTKPELPNIFSARESPMKDEEAMRKILTRIKLLLLGITLSFIVGCGGGGSSTPTAKDIAIDKIMAYAEDGSKPTPSLQDYLDAGVSGVNSENLTQLNAVVDGLEQDDVDTTSELEELLAQLDIELPVQPQNLKAEAGNEKVTLSWDLVTGATAYDVCIATETITDLVNLTCEAYQGGRLLLNSSNSTVVTGLTNGTKYFFIVTPKNTSFSGFPSDEVNATPMKDYAIGDIGPAGGIVFYLVQPDNRRAAHGLEAAPEDLQGLFQFGCLGQVIGTSEAEADDTHFTIGSLGKGKSNTDAIVNANCSTSNAQVMIAANAAKNYTFNGFNDWFLPSSGELQELKCELAAFPDDYQEGDTFIHDYGFAETDYWSSSEVNDSDCGEACPNGDGYSAWTLGFNLGGPFMATSKIRHVNLPQRQFIAGANAVYCGLDKFNARNRASNLSFDDLTGIIRLAHKYDCEVFLTINVVILEQELPTLIKLLNKLVNSGIDGIIVQDLGVFNLVKKYFPTLDIHASTQMTTHNEGQIKFLAKLGASRLNLSREMNIHECYSSSVSVGNSGNRGSCSQACREEYEITEAGNKFPLNLKDNSAYFDLTPLDEPLTLTLTIGDNVESASDNKKVHTLHTESNLRTTKDLAINKSVIEKRFKNFASDGYTIESFECSELGEDLSIPFKELTAMKNQAAFLLNNEVEIIPHVDVPQLENHAKTASGHTMSILIADEKDVHLCSLTNADVYLKAGKKITINTSKFLSATRNLFHGSSGFNAKTMMNRAFTRTHPPCSHSASVLPANCRLQKTQHRKAAC